MKAKSETSAEVGRGSRRICLRIPGTDLCLKRYRDDDEVGSTVRREIARGRFDRRLNTCAQEYDYLQELKGILAPDVLAAFPETFELHDDPKMGWHLVESLVLNGDGSVPERFSRTYRGAPAALRPRLYAAFRNLMHAFEAAAARFYDPQNVIVQWPGKPFAGDSFRLRIVDFEPASRTLLPVDSISPALRRRKLRRRVARYLRQHVFERYNPLPWREREAWDALVASEGAKMGLAECWAFLENKLVNDIFYEGMYRGIPCIVKCSSRAPESIGNEYRMSRRLASVDPLVCAEALDVWVSPDGRRAFVVTRRLPGPSLAELVARGADDEEAVAAIEDMIRIAEALRRSGLVWRDIIPDNFMRGADGHYRLIDAQFAVDRRDFREDPYLLRHWTYRNMVFAHHPMMAGRGWNDAAMMLFCVYRLSGSPRAKALCDRLRSMTEESAFPADVGFVDELRMRWTLLRLRFARLFATSAGKVASIDVRIERAKAFLRRDILIWERVLYGRAHEGDVPRRRHDRSSGAQACAVPVVGAKSVD